MVLPRPTNELLSWASGQFLKKEIPPQLFFESDEVIEKIIEERVIDCYRALPPALIWFNIRVIASDVQEMLDGAG